MAIITSVEYIHKYFSNNTITDSTINYLSSALIEDTIDNRRIKSLPIGAFEKYSITDDIYALEQVFFTKPRTECFFESHRKYVDIQMIINGYELIECANIKVLNIKTPYNTDKDIIIYHDTIDTIKLPIGSSNIAIFLPEDAHMGLGKMNEVYLVFKTVIKVPVELWRQHYI